MRIDLKKGGGSVYFAMSLLLLSFFGALLLMEQYNVYNNGVYTQSYADVIADAGAEFGNDTNGGLDPEKVADITDELAARNQRVNQSVRVSIDPAAMQDEQNPRVAVSVDAEVPFLFPTRQARPEFLVQRQAVTVLLPDIYEGIVDMNRFPAQQWKPIDPILTSSEGDRSRENYNAVIDQLWVEKNQRYTDRDNKTFCNIFMWDVTKAMGAEIPYYVNRQTGAAEEYRPGILADAYQQSAADYYRWMNRHGAEYGWKKVSAKEGQEAANRGEPAVALYLFGHCQVIRPFPENSGESPQGNICYAQAGSPKAYGYQPTFLTDLTGQVWVHA